jgi:NTE family protein
MLNLYTTEGIVAAGYDFDRLRIPFRAVATDLLTGKPYVFKGGPLTEALRASSAIPLMFTPVEKDDMLLVDGGLVNNLPTNLAREMGADIVIAVDVTSPLLGKDQLKTLISVMDQTISLQMKLNLEASLKFADLVIRPELEGITYGSYRQVTEIVARGERAALSIRNDLEKLAPGLARRPPPARPRLPAPAIIESITFDGLSQVDSSQLLKELQQRRGEAVNLETIRRDQGRLYATRLFDQVDYRLTAVKDNRYRLTYVVREAPLNVLGASIRFDSDYEFVGLAEFTARELFHTPSFATLSTQFGGLENNFASLRLIHPKLPFLFLEPALYSRSRERLDIREQKIADRFIDNRFGGQFLIGGTIARRLEVSGGFHLERATIAGGTEPNIQPGNRRLGGFRFRLKSDALDDQEYPTLGWLTNFQVDKISRHLGSEFSYSKWQPDLYYFIPLSDKTTVSFHGVGAFTHGEIPFYQRVFIGGYNFSDGGPRQLLGFSRDEFAARQAVIAGAGYRRQIFSQPLTFARRGFLFFQYNMAGVSDQAAVPYKFRFFNGAGGGVLLDTIVGPMRFVGAWGEGGRGRFYISLGPAF